MNEVKQRLQDAVWTGSSTPVFNDDSVRILGGDELEAFGEGLIAPAALIRIGALTSDPLHGEEPDLVQLAFDVILVTQVPGDRMGEHPIMGANRQGLTDSRGRGILELEEELFATLERLGDALGVRVQSIATGAQQQGVDESDNVIAMREYSFEAQLTADRYYHAPRGVSAADLAGGDARIRWTDPPPRFGRLTIRIRSAAGSTAPADASSGDQVADVGLGIGSFVDSPGAGEISYSVFAGYDDHAGATATRFSDAEQATQATVTVSA